MERKRRMKTKKPAQTEAVVKYVDHHYADFDAKVSPPYGLEMLQSMKNLVHEIDKLSRKHSMGMADAVDAVWLADFLEAVVECRAERFNARRAKKTEGEQ